MIDAPTKLDELSINAIRMLSIDAVQQANSGHPGTPMALAPLGYRLFTKHLRFDPANPEWANRDRFVLSCGHASMLLYSLLHLSGYGVTIDDLRNFRQLGSRTPGHPERGDLPGIEVTTGPLGQGIANAVGMALAEQMLAARYNRAGLTVVDHHTYVLASDGDIMEGVQAEAASIAGHLRLGKLTVFYDANQITIDGTTEISLTEDVGARYAACGWHVLHLPSGEDLEAIDAAVAAAHADERPTLVVVRTHIGIGSPKQDSPKAHGSPLGAEAVEATREHFGWTLPPFEVPQEAYEPFQAAAKAGADARAKWEDLVDRLSGENELLAGELRRVSDPERPLPDGWADGLDALDFAGGEPIATRKAGHAALNALAKHIPELVGGSADLIESNLTGLDDMGSVMPGDYTGRNIHFGIREHGMAAAANGMLAHGGLRTFVSTFLIFSDYLRPTMRLAALSELPQIFVFTHDSVWVGEDGPTHQPIEQLASMRAIPEFTLIRPAEANETVAAWRWAIENRDRPIALALSRQNLTPFTYEGTDFERPQIERGAYTLLDAPAGKPDVILIGTGSEVELCVRAAEQLKGEVAIRVVSMPSWDLFTRQPEGYRDAVLPPDVRLRVSVEAGTTFGWERFIGTEGRAIGIDRFGASGPGAEVAASLGLTVDHVVEVARELAARL